MPTPVVAVLNLKGGVGKTTVSAHVSREIFEARQKSVLLIDLDPQYNLTQQLLDQDSYNAILDTGQTVMRLFEPPPAADFFSINTDPVPPPPAREISYKLRHFIKTPETCISLIPGSFELTKYSFIPDNQKLLHCQAYFKKFISAARNEFDLIVLDMNPSSSFLTFAGLSCATDIVSPVRPDKYSMLGLELVKRLTEHGAVGTTPNIHVVMNGVKRSDPVTGTELEILASPFFSSKILSNRLHDSAMLKARSDYTGFVSDRRVSRWRMIRDDLRAVGLEISTRIGL